MRGIKLLSVSMTAVMLMPMLMSCSKAEKSADVVKEDDPWYESTKFELAQDLGQYNGLGGSFELCASNDKVFFLYCFSRDLGETSKTVIDTYDFDGDMVNRTYVSYPDHVMIDNYYTVRADPEGKTINAIVELRSDAFFGPAFVDIDIETGKVSNTKEFFNKETKSIIKDDYAFIYFFNTGAYCLAFLELGHYGGPNMVYQLLLFKDSEFVCELDMSGSNLRELYYGYSIDESANSLYVAGIRDNDNVSLEFDLRTGALKSQKSFAEMSEDEVNFSEYTATADGDMCKMDSLGNIMKIDVNTMTPKLMVDANWYSPFFPQVTTSDNTFDEQYWGSDIISCKEERTLIHETNVVMYGIEDYTRYDYVTVIRKADKNPNAGKKIIELALPPNSGVSYYLTKTIYEFNRSDNEYLIRIWSKYNNGFVLNRTLANISEDEQKIYEMIQDLKGDAAPDLAISIQKNYAMRDDVFMDLTGFLDQEVLDKQFNNILEAGKIGGKLYFLPVTLEIEGLVTNEDLIDEGAVGITFDDFEKLINEDMHGFSPYDYPYSASYNRNSFVLSCIDTKSAIEGDKVDFGTDQFRAAVEYSKDRFTYDDETSMPDDYVHDSRRNRGESYYANINDYLDFVHACYKSKGYYKIIGTPSVDACGPRFKALETISVSATTDVEDGCRKFINYLFSGAAFSNDKCEFRQIVTNKEIMAKNIDALTIRNNDAYEHLVQAKMSGAIMQTGIAEKIFGDKMATDDMRESFLNSMSTISAYKFEDYKIVQFVLEEILPYYAGDRTLDDAIRYLNDRVTKYVREM